MEVLGTILFGIGAIISIVGGIWFIVVAFQESLLWGLGCMVIPFVSLIFLVMHWEEARKPFFVQLIAIIPLFAAASMMPRSNNLSWQDTVHIQQPC